MRVFVLGAGASRHAGYPLAADMGNSLATWIKSSSEGREYRDCLKKLLDAYGTLNNFEVILADLMTWPIFHRHFNATVEKNTFVQKRPRKSKLYGGGERARSFIVPSFSGCDECDALFGQAARAIEENLRAMGLIEKAVLEDREDISDLKRACDDTRQGRKEAVEKYQFHYASHSYDAKCCCHNSNR